MKMDEVFKPELKPNFVRSIMPAYSLYHNSGDNISADLLFDIMDKVYDMDESMENMIQEEIKDFRKC